MHFLHHRQKTRCHVLGMPNGLQELMGDISREVLRCQPSLDCTYKFIADYLDAMIATREKSKIAMEIIEDAILTTDEIYEQFSRCRIPKEKTRNFLDMMETTFRRFIEQKRRLTQDPRYITFHADDMLDELIRKCDLTKVEILRSRPAIQWAYKKFVQTYLSVIEGTLDTEDLYLNTDKIVASCKEMTELNESANKIQKVYRGYETRKPLEDQTQPLESWRSFEEFIADHQDEVNRAAVKIQASYKGFKVRKKKSVEIRLHDVGPTDSFERYAAENQEELNKAAVKIQATYKGFNTRQKLHSGSNITTATKATIETKELPEKQESLIDLENAEDIDDLNKAAVKIQSSFKGYKVRKEMGKPQADK